MWPTPVIPALRKLGQKDCFQSEASLGYEGRPHLKGKRDCRPTAHAGEAPAAQLSSESHMHGPWGLVGGLAKLDACEGLIQEMGAYLGPGI